MGLDMYLLGRVSKIEREEHEGYPISHFEVDLAHWRKHPNLHGFIVNTFAGGEDRCVRRQYVRLFETDVLKIIEAIKDDALPHTEGFFFGTSEKGPMQRAEDVALFEGAMEWVDAKKPGEIRALYYLASW